jgi:hypothetical protein
MALSLRCEDVARAAPGEPAKHERAELLYRSVHPEQHANAGTPMLSGGDGGQHG